MWSVVLWGRCLGVGRAFVVPGGETKEGRAFGASIKL